MKLTGGHVILSYYVFGLITIPILIWTEEIAEWMGIEVKALLVALLLIYLIGIGLVVVLSVKWEFWPDWTKTRYILGMIGFIMLTFYVVGALS